MDVTTGKCIDKKCLDGQLWNAITKECMNISNYKPIKKYETRKCPDSQLWNALTKECMNISDYHTLNISKKNIKKITGDVHLY